MTDLVVNPRMNELEQGDWRQQWMDKLRAMGPAKVKESLFAVLSSTVENFKAMAMHVCYLDEIGDTETLSKLPAGFLNPLRKIGQGQMLPDVLELRFQKRGNLEKALSNLPISEQKRLLVEKEPVTLIVRQNGTVTHRLVPVLDLRDSEIKQVFGPDGRRSEAQQLRIIDEEQESGKKPAKVGPFELDYERGILKFTGKHGDAIDPEVCARAARTLTKFAGGR